MLGNRHLMLEARGEPIIFDRQSFDFLCTALSLDIPKSLNATYTYNLLHLWYERVSQMSLHWTGTANTKIFRYLIEKAIIENDVKFDAFIRRNLQYSF